MAGVERWLGAAALLLCVALPAVAFADDDTPKDQAERFFLRGKDLMTAGHYEQACVAFDESLRIDRAGGTLLNLAECYVALGKFASATAQLAEAQKLAEAAHRDDKAEFAKNRIAEIAPRVDHLAIRLPRAGLIAYKVTLDGHAFDASDPKHPSIAVDPGAHKVQSTAAGYQASEITFEIHGEHSDLTIDIPLLIAVEPKATAPSKEVVATHRSPQWTVGWSVGSVGVAGLLVGAGIGAAAISTWHDATKRCPATDCSDLTGISESAQAKTLANGSSIAFGIGAAASALGLILVLTTPHQKERARLAVGAQSLHLQGSF